MDELRLAHANDATPADWPPGQRQVDATLLVPETGRPWIPVSVDDNRPVPFLVQNGAVAVAVTGARVPRELPGALGRMSGVEALLPGVSGGRLVHNRRLGVGPVLLQRQGLLVVDESAWPHGRPGGGAAGVIGYDLFRRFVVEIDRDQGRLSLLPSGEQRLLFAEGALRLAVLDRRPYLELEGTGEAGRGWLRLQLEIAWPGAVCLDAPGAWGGVLLPGGSVAVDPEPCGPRAPPRDPVAGRDGVLGYGALPGRRLLLDYEGARAAFLPSP